MANLEIYRSVPDDAEAIGKIRAANWKEQYAPLDGVTAEWMEGEIERIAGSEGNQGRAHWIEKARQPEAQNYWLSARLLGDQALAGFLEARRHADGTQELRSLHISLGRRGLGVGQALMNEAHAEWFDPSADTYLDVAQVNTAGQRFYRRSPNNYELTGHTFMYGPIAMTQMARRANSEQN